MYSTHQIEEQLKATDRHHALALWEAICDYSETDAEYRVILEDWLDNGGTVTLRDDLCAQFKDHTHLYRDHEVHKKPWLDAWMAIASSRHEVTFEDTSTPPGP